MLNKFKNYTLAGFLFLMTLCSNAQGNEFDQCHQSGCQPFYVGVFGGLGRSGSSHVSQKGIAFFSPPLDVDAEGSARRASAALGGIQIGYQLRQMQIKSCGWCITPAIELEASYLKRRHNKTGDLINITDRLPEHDFIDTLPMHSGVFLINGILAFNIPSLKCVQPYIGAGLGTTKTWIRGADSEQVSPVEVGVNHFNSRTNDSDWAFAAQAKVGVRFNLSCNWRLFAEYRFLHQSSTNYTFGDTQYPTHVPTTDWKLHFDSMNYNLAVVGIQYSL